MTDKELKELREKQKAAGEATRAKYYPYHGRAKTFRASVDEDAARIVASIDETQRAQFLTEAIIEEHDKRRHAKG